MDKSRIFVGRQHHGNCFSCCRWKPRNGLRNPLINAMGNRKGLHQPFALFHLWTMNENYEAYKGLGRNTYLNLIKIFRKKTHTHTNLKTKCHHKQIVSGDLPRFQKKQKKSPCRDPTFMIYWFPRWAPPNVMLMAEMAVPPCLRQRRRTSPEMTIINWAPSSGASETPKEPGFQVSTPGSDSAIGGVSLRDGSQPDLTQYFGKL